MASLRIQKVDAIVFQLLRKNLNETNDQKQDAWEEVKVVSLAVKPATMSYDFGSRSAVLQTEPSAGFVDRYGEKLPRVMMSGTFGVQPRRAGLQIKDGRTRLLEFRDEVFRRSQLARSLDKTTVLGRMLGADGQDKQYVYAVNFYDFINEQFYNVNLDTLRIQTDARRNPIEPTYQIQFTCLGDQISVQTSDPLLLSYLSVYSLGSAIDSVVGTLGDMIGDSSLFKLAETVVGLGEGMNDLAGYLQAVSGQYVQAITGTAKKFTQINATTNLNSAGFDSIVKG